MVKSKVISRFYVFSKTESKINFKEIVELLPKDYSTVMFQGERKKLTTGKLGPVRKESSVMYSVEYIDVYDISVCNESFMKKWAVHERLLKKISNDYDIKYMLDYEISIDDSDYPGIVFDSRYLKFLGAINCNFAFDFYEK